MARFAAGQNGANYSIMSYSCTEGVHPMPDQPQRRISPLADTLCEVDFREVPRTVCPVPATVRVVVRPSFAPLALTVKDLSVKGISLIARGPTAPLPAGAHQALFWKYGPPERWRTLRLDVVWRASRTDGGWIAGCMFAERLAEDDVEAFLQQAQVKAAQTEE